jgi:hypothetical protein
MDESRLEALERRLAQLEARHQRCFEGLSCDTLSLDCRVITIQKMLRDYDVLVRMVAQSYRVTHPEKAKAILEADDIRSVLSMPKPPSKP